MMLPTLDAARDLPGPFEILELRDGQSVTLRVRDWEHGKVWIQPRDGRDRKQVLALRLHLQAGIKATLPQYYDVLGQHLVAGLWPYLSRPDYPGQAFKITMHGSPPQGRPSLEVSRYPA
jgi:hypothetical protein